MRKVAFSSAGNGLVAIRPVDYLGSSFSLYRDTVGKAGFRYEPSLKCQIGSTTTAQAAADALLAKGFAVEFDSPLAIAMRSDPAPSDAERSVAIQGGQPLGVTSEAYSDLDTGAAQSLYAYQRSGIGWLRSRGSALLADEPGLGKTCQSLLATPLDSPLLVVAPSSVKLNWIKEAARWRPDLRAKKLDGRKSFRFPEPGEMCVTTWDSLPSVTRGERGALTLDPAVGLPHYGTILIYDEIHKAKSSKSKRNAAARCLDRTVARLGGKTIALTGTPLVNGPGDLWTVLMVMGLAKEAYGSYPNFMRIFGGRYGRFGIEWDGMVDSAKAVEGLRRVSLRRTADDHLDLPDITRQAIPVEIDKKTLKICDELVALLGGAHNLEQALALAVQTRAGVTFEALSAARQALAIAKSKALLELVSDLQEQGEPVVVFSCHRAPLDALGQLENFGHITGSESPEARQATVAAFQERRLSGVAISILAGAEGITLTRAKCAVFVDRWWNPAINTQAEARLRRIGQTASHIHVIDLVANHAVDENLLRILTTKNRLIEDTVDASTVC